MTLCILAVDVSKPFVKFVFLFIGMIILNIKWFIQIYFIDS